MNLNFKFLKSILVLTSLIIVSTVPLNCVFASSSNWSEVARFTYAGTNTHTTDSFTCENVEWRIKWEYVPTQFSYFNFDVYPIGEDVIFASVNSAVTGELIGILDIHNQAGTFYMKINSGNVEGYTVIVEQDLDSIPEFPLWIILPLFITATIATLVLRKRLYRIAK
ncbi:hypothetical protein ACFLRN_02995 [Thermoproteota archaeon]